MAWATGRGSVLAAGLQLSQPGDGPGPLRLGRPRIHRVGPGPARLFASPPADKAASLFNSPRDAAERPLVVHLPASPSVQGAAATLPGFLAGLDLPVASINYRWVPPQASWPTPIHDAATAFAWLAANLAPPAAGRRDVYVYSAHLGASIAASLALTEAHADARFGVRGLVAYNGVYNWTMLHQDHSINKGLVPDLPEPSHLHKMHQEMRRFFGPDLSELFDPFASPSLFFHSPGMLQPLSLILSLRGLPTAERKDAAAPPPTPRKSYLVFPPRNSTLQIPQTLLLHDSPLQRPGPPKAAKARTSTRPPRHSLAAQAEDLAGLMRRSVRMFEMKQNCKQDKDGEAQRRVQVADVGPETASVELSDVGQAVVLEWLRARI